MQQESRRYRVHQGVGAPPPSSGRPRKWADLPLDTVEIGDLIEIPMDKEEVEAKIASIRSYVWRVSQRNSKKYSVRKTDFGIGIWRVAKVLPSHHSYQIWKRRIKR